MPVPLNPRQAAFCREYAVDLNATQAAIRAGYSRKGAEPQAFRLLRDARVAAEVQRLGAESAARADLAADDVRREVASLAFACLTDVVRFGHREVSIGFDEDGNVLSPAAMGDAVRIERQTMAFVEAVHASSDDLPVHVKAAVAVVKMSKDGSLEIRMHDKGAALDKAARLLGLYKPDEANVRVRLEDIVAASLGAAVGRS